MSKKIFVTEPSLPPLDSVIPYLEQIWENKWLTNNGVFHIQLEEELTKFLKIKQISLFTNGTIALIAAFKALNITGEVITTPYSFIATAHSLVWNNIDPVFCDIHKSDFNIDPDKIERLITEKTSAILPVHVYGNPCNHEKINKIAQKYGLKVIYDAAHAFGVEQNGESVLNYGDLSILSFHATKVFNTFEGGAIVCHTPEMKKRIDLLKNFGIKDEISVTDVGINGKMNEFQSVIGILQLKNVRDEIKKRAEIAKLYRKELPKIKGIQFFEDKPGVNQNYSYFPILVEDNFAIDRDRLYKYLMTHDIYTRRYFYPLISNFDTYIQYPSSGKENLPVANYIADRILCLPIYPDLPHEKVLEICSLIQQAH